MHRFFDLMIHLIEVSKICFITYVGVWDVAHILGSNLLALEGHPIDSYNHHRACGSVLQDFRLEIKSMATVECMHTWCANCFFKPSLRSQKLLSLRMRGLPQWLRVVALWGAKPAGWDFKSQLDLLLLTLPCWLGGLVVTIIQNKTKTTKVRVIKNADIEWVLNLHQFLKLLSPRLYTFLGYFF
jgi:hypothetical protein